MVRRSREDFDLHSTLKRIGRDAAARGVRGRLIAVYTVLAVLNVGGWLWALACFGDRADLLGIALLVYGLGLRHAVDADHIAAIDNVTRKLIGERQTPVAVGFFFSIGHSALVILGTAAIALLAGAADRFQALRDIGGLVGTGVSALVLFAIAAMNFVLFLGIVRAYRQTTQGLRCDEQELERLLDNRGWLARLFRPLFKLVTRSHHMVLLGFLFGLGFDTATEIATFGISAAQAAKGMSFLAVLVFPVLFAAGMALVDTTDGVMMLGAYRWATVTPARKLRYNMVITLISVLAALGIGSLEVLGLLRERMALAGPFWEAVGSLNESSPLIGAGVVLVFAVIWAASVVIGKMGGRGDPDLRSTA